jgi:hypothetical protein
MACWSARITWHRSLAHLKKFLEQKYGNNGIGVDEWNSAAQPCQLKEVAPARKPGSRHEEKESTGDSADPLLAQDRMTSRIHKHIAQGR